MKASVVDLRYKMNEVLSALARRERVTISFHGKVKGVIIPTEEKVGVKVSKHPFFGMSFNEKKDVEQLMEEMRGGRYRDI